MSGYQWDRKNIPHKGWICVGIEDVEDDLETCEMCGHEEIRYVHIMRHPDWPTLLRVGCICAEHMTDDYVNPRKQENALKRKAIRRKNFLKKEWTYNPEKGTYYKKYKGEYITILQSRHGNWGIFFADHHFWSVQQREIPTFEAAEWVAFLIFERYHTTKDERYQAYLDSLECSCSDGNT